MPQPLTVIKLSGKALVAKEELKTLFTELGRHAVPFLLVHGGGVEVDALMNELGREVRRVNGLRVSPAEDMGVIAGALAGTCSLTLRGIAQSAGLSPVGLSATDLGLCTLLPKDPSLGRVAGTEAGNAQGRDRLLALLKAGLTPVVSSVGIDAGGDLWNINADEVAVSIAELMHAPLVFLSDVKGVLDAAKTPVERLTQTQAAGLIAQGVIAGGMTVKVNAAFDACRRTHAPVCIASAFDPEVPARLVAGKLPGTAVELS